MSPRNKRKSVQCAAHSSRTGERCRRPAIIGATVCRTHGGAAPQVKRKAAERVHDLIDPDRALREAARVAYSDIRKVFGKDGQLLSPEQWPDDVAATVQAVDLGDGRTRVAKIKLWNKLSALEFLLKHLGLLQDRVHVSTDWDELAARLAKGRRRASKGRTSRTRQTERRSRI